MRRLLVWLVVMVLIVPAAPTIGSCIGLDGTFTLFDYPKWTAVWRGTAEAQQAESLLEAHPNLGLKSVVTPGVWVFRGCNL